MKIKRTFEDVGIVATVILVVITITLLQVVALQRQIALGIMPNSMVLNFSQVKPRYTLFINNNEGTIPVTGEEQETILQLVRYDDFSGAISEFVSRTGQVQSNGHELILSPRSFEKYMIAVWKNDAELPERYLYGADFLSPWSGTQKYGLAIQSVDHQTATVFLIDSNSKTYSMGRWQNAAYTPLFDWIPSEVVHEALSINSLKILCRDHEATFYVNQSELETITLEDSCDTGKLGFFVLAPSWFVSVDNAYLAYLAYIE